MLREKEKMIDPKHQRALLHTSNNFIQLNLYPILLDNKGIR